MKRLHSFSRTELLLGSAALEILADKRVAVFGLGGVGSYTVEALVRSGIRNFLLVDHDLVCLTNLNRQIHATVQTVGRPKTELMQERIMAINPQARVTTRPVFFTAANADEIITPDIDYIVDAIDTVSSKISLVLKAREMNIPIISCMGAANKLDPTKFRVADIFSTQVCPLAKVMRQELRKRGIAGLKVVYSEEPPLKPKEEEAASCHEHCICPNKEYTCTTRRQIPGSVSFVPPVAGLIAAGEVIKDLLRSSGALLQ